MATKWTLEQEEIILEEVKKSPEHLRDAFHNASLKIKRSSESICTHYYNKMMNFEKIKHGGKRPNSGRKKGIETTTIRIPLSLKEIIQRYVKRNYAKQRTIEELKKEEKL